MPTITIGATAIDYTLERRQQTRLRKIIVTPDEVRVIAPSDDNETEILDFLNRKRAWLYSNFKSVAEVAEQRPRTLRFMTGSKVPYRGRQMRIVVEPDDIDTARVSFRSGFIVAVPRGLPAHSREIEAREALRAWLFERARQEARGIADTYAPRMGVMPRRLETCEMSAAWGACGKSGVIRLDWRLICAPRAVHEYAIVHELAHLIERSHSERFWTLIERTLPDYATAKFWLESRQASLHFGSR